MSGTATRYAVQAREAAEPKLRPTELSTDSAMPRFLVPVDGSESAMRAARFAIDLAKDIKMLQLHFVTVHPEPVSYGEIAVYASARELEELQNARSADLLQPALDAAKRAGVPYTSEILSGEIAPAIVNRADELACHGIIIGTRGMSALGNLVMGSVASKVVHLTRLPVTLIK
jgi:nucleotide-binding universal stress UspA family protein